MEQQLHPHVFAPAQKNLWVSIAPSIWTLDAGHVPQAPLASILRTVFDQPRWLEAYHLYDEAGSHLFEKICKLPEHYQTRTEDAILEKEARKIIASAPVECIVELGAGFSKKTIHLLTEQVRQRNGGTFVPVDVSPAGLSVSREVIKKQFPKVTFHGLQAQFEEGITSIDSNLPTLFVFLGGTAGNFRPSTFLRFFEHLSQSMGPGDFFLIGVDRVKDVKILERAYNDSQGITSEFILNVFDSINRLTKSNFDRNKMRYYSWFNSTEQRIEMHSISTCDQEIRFPSFETSFLWQKEERVLVEISRKFDPNLLQRQLRFFGLSPVEHFTDPKEWFSVLLFRKS